MIGEADGDIKYLDPAIPNGRTAEEVVSDEKVREDRFRALPRTVTRWRWPIAIRPERSVPTWWRPGCRWEAVVLPAAG